MAASPDKGSGCTLTVEYFPDMSQEYIIIPHIGMGSLTVSPTLAQGWNLVALQTSADSKTAELISSISGLAGNLSRIVPPSGVSAVLGPGLYRFEFENGQIAGVTEVFRLYDEAGTALTCPRFQPPPRAAEGQQSEKGKPQSP